MVGDLLSRIWGNKKHFLPTSTAPSFHAPRPGDDLHSPVHILHSDFRVDAGVIDFRFRHKDSEHLLLQFHTGYSEFKDKATTGKQGLGIKDRPRKVAEQGLANKELNYICLVHSSNQFTGRLFEVDLGLFDGSKLETVAAVKGDNEEEKQEHAEIIAAEEPNADKAPCNNDATTKTCSEDYIALLIEHDNEESDDGSEVRGKILKISQSQDNHTLYLGNISKTWKQEEVSQQLKQYGMKHIDMIRLPENPKIEGKNKGFAFLEFNSHSDAVTAYQRLKKPDAVFGRDISAKVAFAQTPVLQNDEDLLHINAEIAKSNPKMKSQKQIFRGGFKVEPSTTSNKKGGNVIKETSEPKSTKMKAQIKSNKKDITKN
ncbi:hypothetical protein LXL04_003897 [Taraxacum kok-saghyz]